MNRDHRVANTLALVFSTLSLVLLSLPLSGKVLAFRACVSYLLNPIPYYGGTAVNRLHDLPEKAAQLITGNVELFEARRRLKESVLLEAELAALREENARLREAAGLAPEGGHRVRWAEVLQRDPLHWHRSLRVAAGTRDGVRINAPVLGVFEGSLGVVGRITQVSPRTATVLLVTDELSAVAGRISDRWEGLVQGQGSSRLRMDYLPVKTEFELGETVYTSETSAAFPAGIPVGTVSRVFEADPFLAFRAVELEPAVPASSVREVLILEPLIVNSAKPAVPKFLPPPEPKPRRAAKPAAAVAPPATGQAVVSVSTAAAPVEAPVPEEDEE